MSNQRLQVRNLIGDLYEEDCSCDSAYMREAMIRVGEAIRSKYYWLAEDQKCYLVMDNAGGHGTAEAIDYYKSELFTRFNVELIFQVPRSPFTDVLDLGIWMSLQSIVERRHFLRRCTTKALHNTVMAMWNSTDLNQTMLNVFGRLKVVMCNILKGGGGNDLVEDNRGIKTFISFETSVIGLV